MSRFFVKDEETALKSAIVIASEILNRLPTLEGIENWSGRDNDLWKIYEMFICHKSETIPWQVLPENLKIHFSHDMGIDGFRDGLAVQAKYHSTNSSFTFRELGTFFTASTIIGATSIKLFHNERCKAHRLASKVINLEMTKDEEFFEWCRDLHQKTKSFQIEKIEQYFAEEENTESDDESSDEIEEISDKDDLVSENVFVPEIKDLEDITLRPYQKECLDFIYSCPKSSIYINLGTGLGKSIIITHLVKNCPGRVIIFVPLLYLMHQLSEAIPGSVKVGTNYTDNIPNGRVYICVNNSSHLFSGQKFDLVIYDEAHHIENSFDREEGHNRNAFRIEGKKKIFLSGTLISQADFNYSIRQGIDNGYLNDYLIHIPVLSGGIEKKKEALARMIQRHPEFLRILAYCNTVESALEFQRLLNEKGISNNLILGTTPLEERIEIITSFRKGEIRTLISVDTLKEGCNIPEADTCLFVDDRIKRIPFCQRLGRILRLSERKSVSHLICPSFNEDTTLIKIIKILENYDPEVKNSIEQKRRGRILFEFDGSDNFEIDFFEVGDNIYNSFYQKIEDDWWNKFRQLESFFKIGIEKGISQEKLRPNKRSQDANEKKLGNFLMLEKLKCKLGKLPSDKSEAIKSLPGYPWPKKDTRLRDLEELALFMNTNLREPKRHETKPYCIMKNYRLLFRGYNLPNLNKEFFDLINQKIPNFRWDNSKTKDERTIEEKIMNGDPNFIELYNFLEEKKVEIRDSMRWKILLRKAQSMIESSIKKENFEKKEKWQISIDELSSFIEQNGLPTEKEEQRLFERLRYYRQSFRGGKRLSI